MKKLTNILVSVVMMLCSIVILSACKPKIESGYVKTGTLETTIVKGEELDTTKTIVVYTYSDSTTKEVRAQDLTFGEFDSTKVGTQELKITYEGFSFTIDIKVVASEADVNSITSLESELINDYNQNRLAQDNEQQEFKIKDAPLYVGDDNPFDFRIFATGIDSTGNLQTNLTKVRTNIIVKLKTGELETIIPEDVLSEYVFIDTENTTLDFTEKAIGKEFKVEVSAKNRDEIYAENPTSFEAVLTVVDGYNVYNARDLSVYDNVYESYNSIKPTTEKVNAVILQNDISIKKDDVRQDMFWTTSNPNYNARKDDTDQTLEGTPIDDADTGIYHRQLQSGETFNFYGNYFKVDLSAFPKMVVEREVEWEDADGTTGVNVKESECMTSHFSVFYNENITPVTSENKNTLEPSELNFENIYFFGNGELNAKPENSGAIILCKATKTNYTAKNNIVHNFYITNFFSQDEDFGAKEGYNVIDNCKAYNSYQCLIYAWGTKSLKIIDSAYKNAGGPAMIVDHVGHDSAGNGGYPSFVDIINSKIESHVSGKEPWFTIYDGASALVAQLITADQLFTGLTPGENGEMVSNTLPQTNKTFVFDTIKDETGNSIGRINLMVAMKSGSKQSLSGDRIHGYVRMFDTMEDYKSYYGIDDVEQKKTTYGLDMTDGGLMDKAIGGNLYFENNVNGGYINPNVDKNQDASFVKPVTLYTIIKKVMCKGTLTDEANAEIAEFQTKDIETMKEILKTTLQGIKAIPEGGTKNAVIQTIYDYACSNGLLVNDEADNTNDLKMAKLTALVDTFISHADGKYINVYIFNGMGAMLELYPVKK